MNTIFINSWILDNTAAQKFEDLDISQEWDILMSDKVSIFSQESKKSLIKNFLYTLGVKKISIWLVDHESISNKTTASIVDNLYLFSSDYMKNSLQNADKISCYESSIANIIGRYHWSLENKPENCDHFLTELTTYLDVDPESALIQQYLSHNEIKKESLAHIHNLTSTPLKTIDNIITKEIDGEIYLLIGQRKEYPKWSALLWGFIDYTNDTLIESDQTIADRLWLEDLSLVTWIREWIEEASWVDPKDLHISYSLDRKNDKNLLLWTENISWFMVAIDIDQSPIDYIEDPQDFWTIPADARGPVANRARHMTILQGLPAWSDDIESVDWINIKDLENIEFAMPHHRWMLGEFLEKD